MGILTGLKVLDFSTLLPGPFATMMLADMGADVLKVESPYRVDLTKFMEPMDGEVSAAFGHLNRSKRSLALDLKLEEAREVVYQLVRDYDIIVEQFRPGIMDKLGIGYEKLKQINPKVIYCSITGYGQTGPLRNKAGHDINYLSLAGTASYSSRKNQAPIPTGIQVADLAGGSMPAVIGILAAVYHRDQTGEGQYIDISITDSAFALNALYGSGYLVGGVEPEAESLLLNGGSFYDYYETKDHRFFSVGSIEPQFQARLCELIGDSNLQFLSGSQRKEDQHAFKKKLTDAFKQKTFEEWLTILGDDFDGCVEPVLTFSESVRHPQIKARNLVVSVPKPEGGTQKQIAFPIKFSTQPAEYRFTGTQTGTHSEDILKEAGFDQETINALSNKGAFGKQVMN
ncbi:CaiB/BaiF CoA-transferase family protein [Bacillus sp. DTU_2020_1000418_1_SI_GHA_SEK_038]|uniref:CaiB/BaiF CoA transferase family protein n=1 Tax=Bacillus sp. DTU_2020_1000418_1_SI_GHA_SEK_038 TaxID=3077585 RepID=UPI0028E6AD70|nr:CaiB/BaiF CoA-transferase family protein [Bacillus sp. DTU_2020_1000418_1_SI_GHA_SEK_038]WNS76167.1 CaiB/BaiF CoA-transferase family protein [Bacillus sp. DTU_2020_1000418_1_SI_GHA_SEK_038]